MNKEKNNYKHLTKLGKEWVKFAEIDMKKRLKKNKNKKLSYKKNINNKSLKLCSLNPLTG